MLQSSGTDISAEKFDACFMERENGGKAKIKGARTFKNSAKGHQEYLKWCRKRKKGEVVHVMEATGVYHEELCHYLHANGERVSVQLPQKVRYFAKSLNLKTKTDRADSRAIALMGIRCDLEAWKPLSKGFKQIRDLCRALARLKKGKSATSSQLHAMRTAHGTLPESIAMMEELRDKYGELIEECEGQISELVGRDEVLSGKVARICAIKGLRTLTVVRLLAETDGFRNCSSISRLVSYAGLDVVHRQSGKYEGKSRISKMGNANIRAALYMPALSAMQHDKRLKPFYERLKERLPYKKQAITAVMRKLLVLVYTLWKNGREYDPDHQWQKKAGRTPQRIT